MSTSKSFPKIDFQYHFKPIIKKLKSGDKSKNKALLEYFESVGEIRLNFLLEIIAYGFFDLIEKKIFQPGQVINIIDEFGINEIQEFNYLPVQLNFVQPKDGEFNFPQNGINLYLSFSEGAKTQFYPRHPSLIEGIMDLYLEIQINKELGEVQNFKLLEMKCSSANKQQEIWSIHQTPKLTMPF